MRFFDPALAFEIPGCPRPARVTQALSGIIGIITEQLPRGEPEASRGAAFGF
jgi:hypothetical protein